MKKIFSNQVLERTFSNHVFEIDVDSIEKLIDCSLQGGPFGGPACPPVIYIESKKKYMRARIKYSRPPPPRPDVFRAFFPTLPSVLNDRNFSFMISL